MIAEFGGVINRYFSRNIYVQYDNSYEQKLINFASRCQYTDVYECIYKFDTFLPMFVNTCKVIAPFYMDLDMDIQNEEDYKEIKIQAQRVIVFLTNTLYIPEASIQLFYSGNKGFHILVDSSVLGVPPLFELNQLYKYWAVHIAQAYHVSAIDTKVYDRRRLIRVPNTINGKSGLYKIPIAIHELYNSTYDSIRAMAKQSRPLPPYHNTLCRKAASVFLSASLNAAEKKTNKSKGIVSTESTETKRELLPCIKFILQEKIEKGARNNISVVLANSLFQSHYSVEEVEELITEWNQNNEPPLPNRELRTTIMSAYSMYQNGRGFGCASIKELGCCVGCELEDKNNERRRY